MRNSRLLGILMAIIIYLPTQAQDTLVWDLNQCIEYALHENIQIKRSRIAFEESREDTKTAEAALFPDLFFSTSQGYTNQPWINNSIDDNRNSYTGSYGLNSSWTVYNGGRRLQTIDQQKLQDQIAFFNIEQSENTIEEAITQAYIQIIYAYESVLANENTVALSLSQVERARALFEVGVLARSDVAQLEAQYSNDKYLLISSEAALRSYKLQLKQLLELEEEELEVIIPDISESEVLIPIPEKNEVYLTALSFRPEIQGSLLSVEYSHMNIGIARSGYMPTISLSAGLGTGHNTASDFSFTEQVKSRWNESIGITLSLPIFNNRQTKSAVNKARLAFEDSKLAYLTEQKALYSTVENLWLDASTAQERLIAAMEKLNSAQISYDLVSEQFNVGLRNTVELLTEMNNIIAARQEVLQAKYTALLNIQLLRFYQGERIEL